MTPTEFGKVNIYKRDARVDFLYDPGNLCGTDLLSMHHEINFFVSTLGICSMNGLLS